MFNKHFHSFYSHPILVIIDGNSAHKITQQKTSKIHTAISIPGFHFAVTPVTGVLYSQPPPCLLTPV